MEIPSDPISTAPLPADLLAGKARPPASGRSPQEMMKAAKDFESVLLHRLLVEMKNTIGSSGLLEDEASSQIQDMVWMNLAQELGRQGGLGLWKDIYAAMGRLAAAGQADPSSAPEARP